MAENRGNKNLNVLIGGTFRCVSTNGLHQETLASSQLF